MFLPGDLILVREKEYEELVNFMMLMASYSAILSLKVAIEWSGIFILTRKFFAREMFSEPFDW